MTNILFIFMVVCGFCLSAPDDMCKTNGGDTADRSALYTDRTTRLQRTLNEACTVTTRGDRTHFAAFCAVRGAGVFFLGEGGILNQYTPTLRNN